MEADRSPTVCKHRGKWTRSHRGDRHRDREPPPPPPPARTRRSAPPLRLHASSRPKSGAPSAERSAGSSVATSLARPTSPQRHTSSTHGRSRTSKASSARSRCPVWTGMMLRDGSACWQTGARSRDGASRSVGTCRVHTFLAAVANHRWAAGSSSTCSAVCAAARCSRSAGMTSTPTGARSGSTRAWWPSIEARAWVMPRACARDASCRCRPKRWLR